MKTINFKDLHDEQDVKKAKKASKMFRNVRKNGKRAAVAD